MATPAGYKPLTVWNSYEACLRICFRNIPALLLAAAVALVPAYAFFLIVQSATIPPALADEYGGPFWVRPAPVTDRIPFEELSAYLAGLALGSIVMAAGFLLATAACCYVVAEGWYGRKPTWRDAWRMDVVGRKASGLIWLAFIGGVLLVVAFLLFIVPGIWLAVAWCVAIPALMFEDARGTRALERSFRLVRRRWWPTLGGVVLIGATGWIVTTPFSVPGLLVPTVVDDFYVGTAIGGTLNILTSIVTTPLNAALITVFFFDLRARKESSLAHQRGDHMIDAPR